MKDKDNLVDSLTLALSETLEVYENDGVSLFDDLRYRRYVIRSAARRLVYGPPKPGTKMCGPLMKIDPTKLR